jgi:CPA2 family monovalent cation:H+ antiporter-2
MPTIIGYLLAGFLLGPHILPEYIIDEQIINVFSSMGVILLMFFIGLELNLRGLRKVASLALLVASAEMTLMILIGYSLGIACGLDPTSAMFLGIIMSVASTAAVLVVMPTSQHLTLDDKRLITGILVMEDLVLVIILTLIAPILPGGTETVLGSLAAMIVGIALFITVSILLGIAVIPKLLDAIRSRFPDEVLFLCALALAFAMALLSSLIGLSVAVGAFLMGVIVSESGCSPTICTRVAPLKELFIATFFISVGFQFDLSLFAQGIVFAILIAIVFMMGKLLCVSTACYLANFSARSCLNVGASLVAMGEFSFLVAKTALDGGLIDEYVYSSVIGGAFITLVAMPFISRGAPRLFGAVQKVLPERVREEVDRYEDARQDVHSRSVVPSVKGEVRKELFLIVVDLVLITCILVAFNMLYILKGVIGDVGADLGNVPSLIAFLVALILTLPLIFILVMRIKKITGILASAVWDTNHRNHRHSTAGRVFKDIGEAFMALLLFLLFLPFLPPVEGLSFLPLVALCVVAVIMIYLIWDAYKAAYRRVSDSIVRGISSDEQDRPE